MTKAEMERIIQVRYEETVAEYRECCHERLSTNRVALRRLAHLNEVRYIASLLGIDLKTPRDDRKKEEKSDG